MAFTKGDRSEVLSLLGKITTTMDGIGRSMRDVHLVVLANPYFPAELRTKLKEIELHLKSELENYARLEEDVVKLVVQLEAAEPR